VTTLAESRLVLVIAGAAILDRGRVLAARRAEPPELAGGWEFPGGKVEPGEAPEDAVVRECREELDVEIALVERLGHDIAVSHTAVLRVWTARILSGTPTALEHAELRWLPAEELFDVPWLPADLPLVRALGRLLPCRP